MAYIYKVQNKQNNKFYIGQTNQPLWRRLVNHFASAKHEKVNNKFYNALRKYPKDVWSIELIEECNKSSLNQKEIYWIKQLKPNYNSDQGGYQGRGRFGPCPESIRKKISKTLKGRKQSNKLVQKRTQSKNNWWQITTPTNDTIKIKDLKQWCENNQFSYNSVKYSIYWSKKKHYKNYKFLKVG